MAQDSESTKPVDKGKGKAVEEPTTEKPEEKKDDEKKIGGTSQPASRLHPASPRSRVNPGATMIQLVANNCYFYS